VIRPQKVLVDCFLDDARAAVRALREQGWPVEIRVDYVPESRGYTVALRFDLPNMPIPREALGGEDA
jgi:hypothetical protein